MVADDVDYDHYAYAGSNENGELDDTEAQHEPVLLSGVVQS